MVLSKGEVALVGAGPGDPELLTLKGARMLGAADVVLYDHLVDMEMLSWCSYDAERVFVGKVPDGPRTPQHRINALLIEHARAGKRVVRLKGGDPFVFGRGGEEAIALAAAEIPCHVVPGVSSCVAAPAAASIPVTHRGVSRHFTVVSGMGSRQEDQEVLAKTWRALGAAGGTIVFLMGVRQLERIVDSLVAGGMDPSTPAALVHSGTTDSQRDLFSTLARIAPDARAHEIGSPATLIVGDVVALAPQIATWQPAELEARDAV